MYFSTKIIVPVFLLISLLSCKEKMTEDEIAGIGTTPCGHSAAFIQAIGFDPNRSSFSTETDKFVGIILVQTPATPNDTFRKYQHPSWASAGYMGSITKDKEGSAYSYPIPFINTFNGTIKSFNSIYKIDAQSGEMNLFTTLPKTDSVPGMVAYGLLGIYYDCHGDKLYASSVNGSTRDKENGSIFVIEPIHGKVVDRIDGIDAIGLCVGGVTGEKKLFFGKARTPEVYSIPLDKEGKFDGQASFELSLDQLGSRGDDKARRIRFNRQGELLIHGIEFNFNLAGQSNKPETKYTFGYNYEDKKWILKETK